MNLIKKVKKELDKNDKIWYNIYINKRKEREVIIMVNINLKKNDDGNYVCELWAASTKHPDSIFRMEDFKTVDFIEPEY